MKNPAILLTCLLSLVFVLPAHAEPARVPWQLVAMNISKGTRGQGVDARLAWAKQAGFSAQHEIGIGNAAGIVKAYDLAGMHLGAVYLYLDAATGKLPDGFDTALESMKAHKPQIWLAFSGTPTPEHPWDERVVGIIRSAADAAAKHGMQVALYPHHNFYAPTIADVLRLANKAERPNVGVAFNLCHFLRGEPGSDWKSALKQAGDRLFTVTITGAQTNGTDWATLIQPLDRGDFPLRDLLAYLKQSGFSGTLGIQDFGIDGDSLEILGRSRKAYEQLIGGLPSSK